MGCEAERSLAIVARRGPNPSAVAFKLAALRMMFVEVSVFRASSALVVSRAQPASSLLLRSSLMRSLCSRRSARFSNRSSASCWSAKMVGSDSADRSSGSVARHNGQPAAPIPGTQLEQTACEQGSTLGMPSRWSQP
eukprot:CAMPEP_0177690804 /NCGR_PEP_ID=MMETSP0484_2-20121128/963_1 /TAXON_ID=354590 /ORGANISM="Rhodomonas lens, Strain RHODO" /LENGTH=136 /DNA_ID=CAMNT_0019201375 /DNA_START=266 /DNA_END=676 /DNA_ORIENTATION=+